MTIAINATDNHTSSMFVFPRVLFKDRVLFGVPPGSLGGTAPSGWLNEILFLIFLEHFISHVKPSKEESILLLLDNHEPHLSVEALDKASKAGIVMVTFPPHTSHKLQQLHLADRPNLDIAAHISSSWPPLPQHESVPLSHVTQIRHSVPEPSSSKEVSDDFTFVENGAQSSASKPYPTNSTLNKIYFAKE
ncbi:hypothetical protein J437_LFUL002857 [Ladona fulva]|uniref:DDE-1 domain-containing protein n=1 Tax=Ladona fulva TaxID=123851 RepID=A0A8K0K2V1_LADFU|nr:hypothetical protein J437_LFUL002857 [Ladona fulva]